MTEKSILHNTYAVQTIGQRRDGGGLGRCEKSHHKFSQIEKYLNRQLPVLTAQRGRGVIIDMHAGDGKTTPFPIPDFFAGGSLKTTPTIAISSARKYGADVILCERNREHRQYLQDTYGADARVISNHKNLLQIENDLLWYPWILAISDPNGHGDQGVEIMQWLADLIPVSDFIVVVNHFSIRRCLGLHPSQDCKVEAARQSGLDHEWMRHPEQWKEKLHKKQVLAGKPARLSNTMEAQVLLVSNWIAGYWK